ncbi:MAG: nucleotide-binding universal stress UspA family protein [Natronomonas sp.]|jgi:nucleotide-binding universal stress UspA family protein
MIERVLVPVDGSEQGLEATKFVVEEFPEATMVLLHVIDPARETSYPSATLPSFSEEWYEREQARAEEVFDEVEGAVGEAVTVERATEVGKPTDVIVDFAGDEDNGIDLVGMGSHGRQGVSRLLLGSVAETVIRRSPVPVTVVR